jgi:aminoglycoside phosphotransferase (APT) family kinase protein
VTQYLVDPEAVRAAVQSAAVSCGALTLVGAPAKRQVLTDGKVLVRAAPTTVVARNSPAAEVAWGRRIAAVVPSQRPLADPIVWGAWTLTVWEWLEGAAPTAVDAWQHGSTLRLLHDRADRPEDAAGSVDQLDSARERLAAVSGLGVRARLAAMLDVAATVLAAADLGELVVSHGDAHDRNLLVVDGVVHLPDFDRAGLAHRHVDVASGVYAWRLNHRDEVAAGAFLDGYGEHPDLDRPSLGALVWVRRIRATCTRAAAGQEVSERLAELDRTFPPL